MVYSKQGDCLIQTGEYFSLTGYNLIYQLWKKHGKPTNRGWQITADDLIKEYTQGNGSIKSYAFLMDFHPNEKTKIGMIELLDIYAYTFSGETEKDANWTPMLLRVRNILCEEYEKEFTDEEKEAKIKKLKNPRDKEDFIEFLYLSGPDKSWNWGRNGMRNATFIHGPAKEYFIKYF